MTSTPEHIITEKLGAWIIGSPEEIQSLWSGYGQIVRYALGGNSHESVIVKHVKLPEFATHPRGWNTSLSHQRKVKSYQVESSWYQNWSMQCDESCRVPLCFAVESSESEFFMLLEDLDESGYAVRKEQASLIDMQNCLKWLANFHATFLDVQNNHRIDEQLWEFGSYWHLQTRPDELEALADSKLKQAAALIDNTLNQCQFKTLVHGDAKLANFCFSENSKDVAAVDFQYVGGGCGMKDVAYFIGSCLLEDECHKYETELLDSYFQQLKQAIKVKNKEYDLVALETEWRKLYYFAWTDFHRFIKGWSPGHWKINDYSERIAQRVIAELSQRD